MDWTRVIAVVVGMGTLQAPQALHARRAAVIEHFTQIIYAPAGDLIAPSDASALGLLSRTARVAEVPFGFEADQTSPRLTTGAAVEAHEVTAGTLRQALDGFVRMDPRYEWRDAAGVFVMRSRTAWSDPHGTLTRRVHDIDWREIDTIGAFNRIAHLLYPDAAHDPVRRRGNIKDTRVQRPASGRYDARPAECRRPRGRRARLVDPVRTAGQREAVLADVGTLRQRTNVRMAVAAGALGVLHNDVARGFQPRVHATLKESRYSLSQVSVSSAPAVIKATPTAVRAPIGSPRNNPASTIVIGRLNLSIGATRDAGPSWSARK